MTVLATTQVSGPEELRALRSAVRGFLERHAPARSQLAADGTTWPRLTDELGLTALPVAEQHGGAGASFVELAVVLEETGRALLRAPYLSTVVAATVLQQLGVTDLLPALADGSAPTALAVDLAQDCGLSLVGFARPGRQVVYSHPQRLRVSD